MGKASIDRPWMKYYPSVLVENMQVPSCTLYQYMIDNMPEPQIEAIHYYGNGISWETIFEQAEVCAKALRALGFGEGSQIPVFLRSVPEFIYLLLAAEKIGASLLCRDNTIRENVDAVVKAQATTIIAHDFLSMEEKNAYVNAGVEHIVLLSPFNSCERENMPDYIQSSLASNYNHTPAKGREIMSWQEFLEEGKGFEGKVEAETNIDRPLYRCYTSGSTGPSKQVIHTAHSLIGVLAQMNFYGGETNHRPTWMVTVLPPALVAVVVSMMLLPLVSRKLLILNPWVDVYDIDLELIRYKPNNWPMIPMFIEILMNSKRIPADYDMSHLLAAGAGAEACNNTQLKRVQKFLESHNCKVPFTTGYGSSEAGSNITFHISDVPAGNGNVGCPMPLTTVAIFKPGTFQELDYGQDGEICVHGPGVMYGYDNEEATAKALIRHPDGKVWLHMGDMGHIDEDGHIYTVGRGTNKRYGGGFLDVLPMENMLADANIPGIEDQFFVNIPDQEHEGYQEPYLYVVLKDGYTIKDIEAQVKATLEPHMVPTHIIQLKKRPFWHFKTNRIGLTNEVLAARAVKGKEKKQQDAIKSDTQQVQTDKETVQQITEAVNRNEKSNTGAIPVEIAAVGVVFSLLVAVVLLMGSFFVAGNMHLIVVTAAVCFVLQSFVSLAMVLVFMILAKKKRSIWL